MQANISRGGRYIVINGKLERVEDPTKPHPKGDAPRDEQGRRLDRAAAPSQAGEVTPAAEPAAAETTAAEAATKTARKGNRDVS